MSEQLYAPESNLDTIAENKNYIPFRKVLATAAATVALAGAIEVPTSAIDEASAASKTMAKPKQLPGAGVTVKDATKEKLQQSTVKILARWKGYEGDWYETCTGTKVNAVGAEYVATAAHCFGEATGAESGLIDTQNNSSSQEPKALDFLHASPLEYAISDPLLSSDQRKQTPLGIVEGIAIGVQGTDWALLKVRPTDVGEAQIQPRTFNDIAPFPYTSGLARKQQPVAGQQVALFGVPSASQNVPVPAKGTYLGRAKTYNSFGKPVAFDYVGIKPKTPDRDTCNFGASGSSFSADVYDGKVAFVSGPLSRRLNTKYDPYSPQYYVDGEPNSIVQDMTRLNIEAGMRTLENDLKVSLKSFTTICGFSVARPKKTINTLGDLVGAFGHYTPAVATKANNN